MTVSRSVSGSLPVAVEAHLAFLRERIFQTATRWPHFSRLLEDVAQLATTLPDDAAVVILERAYVYGGDSLFAPLFWRQKTTVVDCELPTTAERDGYQRSWTDDPRCIHVPTHRRAPITATGLPDACAAALLVPNVVHHVADQDGMFAEMARLLRPTGTGYIFEALLRELHQVPDDYVRYTPWGFRTMLARHGLEMTAWAPAGGPFEAIAYCWVQALQYIPESERAAKERWFYTEHFPELMRMNGRYTENTFRAHTAFPVAYSIYFRRAS
ncbi:MAG: class I SAM-dependent methyltransferase [Anaerolineales bacterium]